MEFLREACEPIIPRKRSSDYSNDGDLEKIKQKPIAVRDFPPGCGIKLEADRKPAKKLRILPSNLVEKMTIENNKLNCFKPNGFERNNSSTCSGPTGKVQFWDPTGDGAQKPKVTTTIVTLRKPLKQLDIVDTNLGKMISPCKDKSVKSQHLQHDKLKSIEPAELGRNKPSFGSKPTGKVKFWDPTCTKESQGKQLKFTTTVVSLGKPLKTLDNVDSNLRKLTSNGEHKLVQPQRVDNNKPKGFEPVRNKPSFGSKEQARREKIKEAMDIFYQVYAQLYQDNRLKPKGEKIAHWRVPTEAAKVVKQRLKWMEPEKSLGPICGVQIGDQFKYRSQLKMIGLHCQLQSGIDYTNIEGKNLALSIVDAHRYSNKCASSDVLIYCGHGGLTFLGRKLPSEDQKLERGNLALKNSIDEGTPVRVIRKFEGFEKNEMFVYDGLYIVNHYTQKRNEEGKFVFEFHLKRVSGQHPLHLMLNASH